MEVAVNQWEKKLLTESEVQHSFRKLFNSTQIQAEVFEKGERLLDELRPESPLRHRLSCELAELRQIHLEPAAKKVRKRR